MRTIGGYIDGRETGQHDMLNWIIEGGFMLVEDAVQWRAWAWCLASNLTIGAALCASFEMGRDYEYTMQLLPGRFSRRASANHEWRPGCGRRAR